MASKLPVDASGKRAELQLCHVTQLERFEYLGKGGKMQYMSAAVGASPDADSLFIDIAAEGQPRDGISEILVLFSRNHISYYSFGASSQRPL